VSVLQTSDQEKEQTMHAVIFVLHNPNKLDKILEAWKEAGITGVTIIESTGIHRRTQQKQRIPMRFQFTPLAVGIEEGNITLMTVLPTEEMIQTCVAAAESIVGDLNNPETGILFSWSLDFVKGVPYDASLA
jgi:nitrogen regulatory protein PII